jgi:hypothetical protein
MRGCTGDCAGPLAGCGGYQGGYPQATGSRKVSRLYYCGTNAVLAGRLGFPPRSDGFKTSRGQRRRIQNRGLVYRLQAERSHSGRSFGSWKGVRFKRTVPSPTDSTRTIENQNWPQTKTGSQGLFFANLRFDSCRFIAATPSALEIVRKTPGTAQATRRPDSERIAVGW